MADRVLLGRYRMVQPIARGGMAEVWEGYDDVLARPVAVKILHPHLAGDANFIERFRREAVVAAKLAHPGIVATFDAGTDHDVAFIVMELVRGGTLRQTMEKTGRLPFALAVGIAAEVADALDHAHRAGLVHRDVKPANILLPANDGSNTPTVRVKVADFGIAKLEAMADFADLTQNGAIVGTAKYLSPEQVQGYPPDARSDEYALGVMLYEMLLGRPPYVGETELATALQHINGQFLMPSQLDPFISPSLEGVVLRAMARRPEDRYPSVAELRAALLQVDLTNTTGVIHADLSLDLDDAVPQVIRDPTPPAGTRPRARPHERRVAPVAFVATVVMVAVIAFAVLLQAGNDSTQRPSTSGGVAGSKQVVLASIQSFDPEGSDREENESQAGLANDGNVATAWKSDRYKSRAFGGLKGGVGLILHLAHPQTRRRLEVRSSSAGWAASVYLATEPGKQLADWGNPVVSKQGPDGDATFDLGGKRAGAVLLWITDPGTESRIEVAEVTLSS